MDNSTPTYSNFIALPSDQDASGRTLSDEEIEAVTCAIRSGVLTSTKGTYVKNFEQEFARQIGAAHAYACSSGTAAIHCAVAALDPNLGDEFITSAITDMGALTPILYQGGIPVFAEVDRNTLCLTAETIEPHINVRTKAIIVTHLFGHPCDMTEIIALARHHNLPVIEDCAQSFLAQHQGRYTGNWGMIGCFSTQQGKHITTGEGGIVVTDNAELARRIFLFINKAWGYGDVQPDHYFLALNYRMSELQGAVALAQLKKLSTVVSQRVSGANRLTSLLQDLPGIRLPKVHAGDVHTFWKYILIVDSAVISGGSSALAKILREHGITSTPRYIQKPAFDCAVFRQQKTLGTSRFPFTYARPDALCYSMDRYRETYAALEQVLVLPWNEHYTNEDIDFIAAAVREGVYQLCSRH